MKNPVQKEVVVIPAKAGIPRRKFSWSTTFEDPKRKDTGFRIKCGMTKYLQ